MCQDSCMHVERRKTEDDVSLHPAFGGESTPGVAVGPTHCQAQPSVCYARDGSNSKSGPLAFMHLRVGRPATHAAPFLQTPLVTASVTVAAAIATFRPLV